MKYLTVDGKKRLEKQLHLAYHILNNISKKPTGTFAWRMHKRYIDGLEFLIDMEELDKEELKK